MSYVIAIAPALVTLVLLAVSALKAGKHYWVFGIGVPNIGGNAVVRNVVRLERT